MPFFRKHFQLILITIVIAVAIFFRFWQIRDYVVFLGDEGRDMIVMRDIFINKRLPFLGPSASVGGFYLGPIYYWMAAPFLFLWGFDPVGPAYFVAIVGVAAVFLLYRFLRETVGFWPAILTSLLYATAPLIVRYSRSSWNPNPLPFFALLMIYLTYLGITRKKLSLFLGVGACLGVAIQLHYLALILLFVTAIIVFTSTNYKSWPKIALLFIAGFLITFSPFLAFEIRHNFPNFRTILEFVTRGSNLGFKTFNVLWLIFDTGNIMLEEVSRVLETSNTKIVFLALVTLSVYGLKLVWSNRKKRLFFSICIIWFLGGLLALRLYTGQIYDYYLGSIFPAPFLISGAAFFILWKRPMLRLVTIVIVAFVTFIFINNGYYKSPPNRLIDQTENIADVIIEKSNNNPYNFALISDRNSDHAYRYFLELKGFKPIELETIITNQLIIVCESKTCEPLGNPAWEIAGFGRGEITQEQDLKKYGIKVFRLTHWQGEPSPAGKPARKES